MSSSEAAPPRRLVPFLILSASFLCVCWLAGQLGLPSDSNATLPIGEGLTVPAGWLIAIFVSLLGLGLGVTLFFPRGLSFRRATVVAFTLAIAARVLVLPLPASDDVNRYLWEGRILAHGFSPYSHAPQAGDDELVDPFRDPDDPIWRGINHPTYTAIYPPLMLGLLAGVSSIAYDALAVKVVMSLFDLATLAVLLSILRRRRLELRWSLLYALSPVALFAFAGEGHNDAVQVFCLTLALALHGRKRWGWTWLLLGLAVQSKVISLLAWPFFFSRESWRYVGLGLLAAVGPTMVFLPFDGGALFESFFAFGLDMAFNGPAQTALRSLLGSTRQATVVCQASFLLVYGLGLVLLHPSRRTCPDEDPTSGVFFVFGAALLLSPTVHFWYLSWILPFLVLRPTASWIVLTATISVTFVPYGIEALTGSWTYPWWGPWAVWSLPVLLMTRDLKLGTNRLRFRRRSKSPLQVPRTVSVVVPTRDEASRIGTCLYPLVGDPLVKEVIVVDAGSTDETRQRARDGGAQVVVHEASFDAGGGRGGQIAAGLARTSGDVVAVVHADTVVTPGTFERALERLARNPDVIGGAVGSVFDGRGTTLRLLELANDFRAAFLGISFGDQVQFFRRVVFDEGRFPTIPLMEDVELSLRLHALGRSCFLWGGCTVSPRRWRRGDAFRRAFLVVWLTGTYLVRRLVGRADTVAMYRKYYGG